MKRPSSDGTTSTSSSSTNITGTLNNESNSTHPPTNAQTGSGVTAEHHLLVKGLDSLCLRDVEGVTPQESESVIASQLYQLSQKEREEVLQDIHGVATVIDETPEFVQERMQQTVLQVEQLLTERHRGPRGGGGGGHNEVATTTTAAAAAALAAVTSSSSSSSMALHPYELAALSNSFFSSDEFRLGFLRADRFEPSSAAFRLLRYFEEKERLFGRNLLCKKEISVSDLVGESLEHFLNGRMQILPSRDRAGRSVFVGVRKVAAKQHADYQSSEDALLRALWVLASAGAMDEETQRKGCVLVYYAVGTNLAGNGTIHSCARMLRALPLRVISIHACVSDLRVQAAVNVAALLIGKSFSLRLRCHCGSDMECHYSLMQFGIPTDVFPIDMTGVVDTTRHASFWTARRHAELEHNAHVMDATVNDMDVMMDVADFDMMDVRRSFQAARDGGLHDMTMMDWAYPPHHFPLAHEKSKNQSNIKASAETPMDTSPHLSNDHFSNSATPQPTDRDILLGRGRGTQNRAGNVHYRVLIESNLDRFECAVEKGAKIELIKEITKQIYDSGVRFWKVDESSKGVARRWVSIDQDAAHDKVGHSFRNARQAQRRTSSGSFHADRNVAESADSASDSTDNSIDRPMNAPTIRRNQKKARP